MDPEKLDQIEEKDETKNDDAPPVEPVAPESVRTDGDNPEGKDGQAVVLGAGSEVTPEAKAKAHKLVKDKVDGINAEVAKLGAVRVNEDGTEVPVTAVFHVEPLTDAPVDEFKCPVCHESFKDGPGLKRHITRKHDGKADAAPVAAPASDAEPEVRPVQTAGPQVEAAVVGGKPGFKLGGMQLFDMLADVLPPPLTDAERDMLSMVKVEVTVPDWAFKWVVLAYVFGPRLWTKFQVLKDKWDQDVAAEEARLEAEKKRKREEAMRASIAEPPAAPVAPQPEPQKTVATDW